MKKPAASLSLDLDNHWSYLKTRGDAAWEAYPTYLDRVVPLALEMLAARGLRITFFVVGQDAARPENAAALASIRPAGHEIGNHSHNHEPWLHRYTPERVREELTTAHEAVEGATGVRPRGFRGPGYSVSEATLETLLDLGYEYDASTLPTFIGPLARAFYFRASGLDAEERRRREALFGHWRDVLRPVAPYRWRVGERSLAEIPVTTMPFLRLPFHFSYLLFIAERSDRLADLYLALALRLCRLGRIGPSLLLHPLDFLGPTDAPGLEFFPGMATPGERKRERIARFLEAVGDRFSLVPVGEHVASLPGDLRMRAPDLRA